MAHLLTSSRMQGFEGKMDEVSMWARQLSIDEMDDLRLNRDGVPDLKENATHSRAQHPTKRLTPHSYAGFHPPGPLELR